jgi:hypothetical protein
MQSVPSSEPRTRDVNLETLSLISRTEEDSPCEFHRCRETYRVSSANACCAALNTADERTEAVLQ